jgi:hypothetical protein
MKTITVHNQHNKWAFEELTESIKDAVLAYGGFDVKVNYGVISDPSDFMIHIFGKGLPVPASEISIIVETDHKDFDLRQRAPIDYPKWTRSLHFFDYGEDLRHENIYFLPLGYSKHFDTNIPREIKRNNFHFGRGGDRPSFRNRNNLWHPATLPIGRERDEYIVTSKVNINSPKYEKYCFTPLHAALIVHKGKVYLEQDYGKDEYHFFKDYIILYRDEIDCLGKIDHWVRHDKEREDFEKFIYDEVRTKHTFEKYFFEAMGDLLEAYK